MPDPVTLALAKKYTNAQIAEAVISGGGIPPSQKGAADGVASLDADALVQERHQDAPERSRRGVIPRPNLRRVTAFNAHDFDVRSPAFAFVSGSAGAFDAVNYETGERSYRLDLVAGVAQSFVLALPAPIDVSDKVLRIRMAGSVTLDVGVLTQTRLRLSTDSALGTYWESSFTGATPDHRAAAGFLPWWWSEAELPASMTKSTGALNDEGRTRIQYLQFTLTASTTVSLYFDRILIHDLAKPARGAVSIRFDDGFYSQYANAAPLLEKYGYRGNFNFASDWLDAGDLEDPGGTRLYMSTAEARDLMQRGHEISVHGDLAHSFLGSAEELYAEVYKHKHALLKRGLVNRGIDLYVHPNHITVYPWSEQVIGRLFRWAVTGGGGLGDEYTLPTVHLLTAWDTGPFRTNLLASVAAGNHTTYMTHKVQDTGGDITPAAFEALLQFLSESDIQVLPTAEMLERHYSLPAAPATEEILAIQLTADLALPAATNVTVSFDDIAVDTLDNWDAANLRYQPESGGYYEVNARVGFSGQVSGETRVSVWRSGAAIPAGTIGSGFLIRDRENVAGDIWLSGTSVVEVRRAATDRLSLVVWSTNAQTLRAGSQLIIRRLALGKW